MKARTAAFALVALLALASGGLAAQAGPAAPSAPAAPTGPAPGLAVDRGEIESARDKPIVFVNYEGPQSRIDSLASIKEIGSSLGRPFAPAAGAARGPQSGRSGALSRYAVIRAVDAAAKEGLDADILVIGADAEVDHVRNLRWIIAGYLGAAWGYSERDAYTLATFITVYNAVHRGDMKYLEARYKAVVRKELTPETAGLSLRFDEWPGKSRILIPLSAGARPGSLGAVDTGAVSDKKVTESLREEPGKGVGDRQALTDLKEREVVEKKAELGAAKDEAAKAEAKAAADKAAADKAADAAAAERAKLEADKSAAAASGPAGAAGAAGAEQSASLATREAEVAAAEKEAAAKAAAAADSEAAAAAKKEEAAKAETAVAAKEAEVAADRAAVSADQKAAIAEEVAAKAKGEAAGVFLFEVVDSGYPFARVVFVDADSGRLIRASTLNTIRARSVVDSGDAYVAVAGREGGAGAVRLVKLDKASLMAVAMGETDVHPESLAWKFGDSFYAVAKGSGGAYVLARFGADLKEAARSTVAVNPFTFLSEAAGGLVAQAAGGGFVVLSKDKLEKTKELKP
ncbi:MAG: hypothetical protein JNG85_17930 [Spirochaetaceae bacterium]|nr:hypothetical protein [Spirochaetaceae bacterium]